MATTANGGHVQTLNGYDVVFSSDCAGVQPLAHEIQSYNPATGAVNFWVVLPNVSHTADTIFYMSYGNDTITTSQENRPAADAARNPAGRSADWLATAANNQNSPSAFYTIYPENSDSIAPSLTGLGNSQTQQFQPIFLVKPTPGAANPLVLLGAATTASPAESLALNGNLAYICDDNEASVFDISNIANPRFLNTALSGAIQNSGVIHCSIQQGSLVAFSGPPNTNVSGVPSFNAFSLSNPLQPQLIASTTVNRPFFREPFYIGNTAFVPTGLYQYSFGTLFGAYGELFAEDIGNLATPTLKSILLTPDINGWGPNAGLITGATPLYSQQLAYLAGSTAVQGFGNWNTGTGKLLVADISNPAALAVRRQPRSKSLPAIS